MKKTLVALAVLAAGSAQAGIEIYNENKVTVNLKGDIEVVYLKGVEDGAVTKQEIQDADFGFDVRYAINDDLQFGGYWEFDGANDSVTKGTSTNVAAGNTYVGLYSQAAGSIIVGRLDTVLDDAGVGSDYQFGVNSFFSNGSPFGGDEAIRYDIDKGTFYGAIAYKQDKNKNNSLGEDGYMVDGKIGARFADFDFTGFYGQADFKGTGAKAGLDKESLWALEGRWAGVENLNLELGYYSMKMDPTAGDSETDNTIAFAADYTMNQIKFAAGVSQSKLDKAVTVADGSDYDSQIGWFVNAGYLVAPGATVYAEVGGNDGYSEVEKNGAKGLYQNGTGFAVGVKAEF
ncbi:porin [Vibrio mediterranei]|jgi:predicted porin|uniref:porin n=1 Tax=Vibrio mediterranei TaxID=689 RepID=UPI001EFE68D3|nr:porin [Vibrio mediterranei]MCG9624074.1 porin [Vibrio mediterranei]